MKRNVPWKKVLEFSPLTILLVGLVLYFYHSIIYYLGAGRDDTFITLWTGISLAEGNGLVNYNFEPMEMSSSLLHTFMVAVINILAPDFIYTINKALGLFTGAILLVVLYLKRNIVFGRDALGITTFALTTLGLANNRAWLYWNMGGLETPFQTLIIFLYGLSLIEFWKTPTKILPLVILQILYILVRPEGFILILFTGILISIRARFHPPLYKKQFITLIGIPSFIFLTILIIRYLNFGLLFPTSVYAKVNLGVDNNTISIIDTGIKYLTGFYTSSPYMVIQLVILIAAVIYFARIFIFHTIRLESNPPITDFKFTLLLGLILFNHLFVVSTGGDWMEFYRFLVPIIPFLTILTTCFAARTANTIFDKHSLSMPYFKIFSNAALGVLFLFAIAANSGQRDNYEMQIFHNCSEKIDLSKIHSLALDYSDLDEKLILMNCAGERDWEGVMLFITDELPMIYEALNHEVTIATFQMGFFPYYLKKINPALNIEFVDTLGLADSKIARMHGPRESYGLREGLRIDDIFAGKSGHLSEYILGRDPNMIYVLNATSKRRMALSNLGWTMSWDQPGAVIFIKKNNQSSKVP